MVEASLKGKRFDENAGPKQRRKDWTSARGHWDNSIDFIICEQISKLTKLQVSTGKAFNIY